MDKLHSTYQFKYPITKSNASEQKVMEDDDVRKHICTFLDTVNNLRNTNQSKYFLFPFTLQVYCFEIIMCRQMNTSIIIRCGINSNLKKPSNKSESKFKWICS